ncbi:hypothetical protein EKO04_006236 [Ascochyta lentis]|uniref:F-box domain-containing protein n=1 Tax=Ascochyta lentis TaxID=205686 RepID=A0A8H7J5K7_9PLEO|nr:hypothetical protein EKO04_006236 [Ascochyta lentis]
MAAVLPLPHLAHHQQHQHQHHLDVTLARDDDDNHHHNNNNNNNNNDFSALLPLDSLYPAHHLTTPHTQPPTPTRTRSSFERLPVEIVNQILSHLVHPRSRLPGLTEAQSAHDVPRQTKLEIKNREDLTTLPDSRRWAADIFDFNTLRHPFHVLSLTSRRLHGLVESYCGHLVRACNMFNLPFAHYDKYGPACVYPDLSHIVYRRLWLQHAPRRCIYCHVALDAYPFPVVKRLIAACEDCFYRQTLTVDEVERQYHLSIPTVLNSPVIRGPGPNSAWVLRIDVEAMALRLYGTRAFHAAHADQLGKPCSICAITRFTPAFAASTRSERGLRRGTTRPVRRVMSQKRRGVKRVTRFS